MQDGPRFLFNGVLLRLKSDKMQVFTDTKGSVIVASPAASRLRSIWPPPLHLSLTSDDFVFAMKVIRAFSRKNARTVTFLVGVPKFLECNAFSIFFLNTTFYVLSSVTACLSAMNISPRRLLQPQNLPKPEATNLEPSKQRTNF